MYAENYIKYIRNDGTIHIPPELRRQTDLRDGKAVELYINERGNVEIINLDKKGTN